MQSEPDVFDESRFIMSFLTILGVIKRLCSFRLVLDKTGKEIPESSRLEFLEKFLAYNFALSEAEDNTPEPLNKGGIYSTFTFIENTVEITSLGSDGFFSFSRICKFGSFKNPFETITSLSELSFRFRRSILLVQTKKK